MYRINEIKGSEFIKYAKEAYGLGEENAKTFVAELGPNFRLLSDVSQAKATSGEAFRSNLVFFPPPP